MAAVFETAEGEEYGAYYVKVTASDAPSNSEQDALTTAREAGPFVVDNTPPQIAELKAKPDGGKLRIRFRATDALSPIRKAEYSLDGSEWQLVLPLDQLSDSLQEHYGFTLRGNTSGEHTVAVRVYDRVENVAVEKIVLRKERIAISTAKDQPWGSQASPLAMIFWIFSRRLLSIGSKAMAEPMLG